MKPTPIIDMFSGTGELARAVADGLNEFTGFQSFSDNYGPARKYLKARFRNVEIPSDFRDQDVPEGSIVAIGAPCQDLSVLWTNATGLPEPRLKDDEGRLNAAFVEWLMGLPSAHAVGLSRTARIRRAGNAVVRLQARLMLQRGLLAVGNINLKGIL